MPGHRLNDVVRQIGTAACRFASDGDVLARFVADRDDAAFAELVRRHGGMVLGVCRRALGHTADAEDAYQATFLVLARKAATVRKSDALSAWLYGIAFRVAGRLRAKAARRREVSLTEVPGPDTADAITWRDGLRVLDEELNRLPEAHRAPLVLCYLEGKTQDEAARQLGWTVGALRGRLERGRARLHARLTRRGIGLAALAAVLTASAEAASVPTALRGAILGVAAAEAASVPAGVAVVAEEVISAMSATKLQWATGLAATCGLLTVGGIAAVGQVPGKGDAPAKAPPIPAIKAPQGKIQLIELAGAAVTRGEIALAEQLLRDAARTDPTLPPPLVMLARLCIQIKAMQPHARAALERAIAENPDHPTGHLTNATIAMTDGRIAEAILSAERAIQLADAALWTAEQKKGFRKSALETMASAFEDRKDWASVRTHSAALLELDGSAQHRIRLAKALFFLDKPDDALAEIQRAVRDAPSHGPPGVHMAWLWAAKGDAKAADEWFAKAIKDAPNNYRVRVSYAQWLLSQNEVARAKELAAEAETIDPKAAEVLRLKARIQAHQGPPGKDKP
ncbi:MAG: sigma-70 family RNA polymerase sigma factor [Gemmataceae bacterium]